MNSLFVVVSNLYYCQPLLSKLISIFTHLPAVKLVIKLNHLIVVILHVVPVGEAKDPRLGFACALKPKIA